MRATAPTITRIVNQLSSKVKPPSRPPGPVPPVPATRNPSSKFSQVASPVSDVNASAPTTVNVGSFQEIAPRGFAVPSSSTAPKIRAAPLAGAGLVRSWTQPCVSVPIETFWGGPQVLGAANVLYEISPARV